MESHLIQNPSERLCIAYKALHDMASSYLSDFFLKTYPLYVTTSAIPCPSNSLGPHLLQHMALRIFSS